MTARGCLWHRRSPLKRSTGRPSRQPVEPELQKETDGRIDRSEVRDTPWDPLARKGRWFVWNSRRGNHLGQRSTKPHQQAGHMDASDPIRPSKTLAARGPSTYGSRLSARYARLAGTTIEFLLALHATASKHQARMPFCACRRFSASSNTTDCGPSITSSVTSSPRCAGRQCMKIASGLARAISRRLT